MCRVGMAIASTLGRLAVPFTLMGLFPTCEVGMSVTNLMASWDKMSPHLKERGAEKAPCQR